MLIRSHFVSLILFAALVSLVDLPDVDASVVAGRSDGRAGIAPHSWHSATWS